MFYRKTLRSSKLAKKKRKRLYFKIAGLFSAIIVVFFALFFVSRMDYFAIEDILVEGNSVLTAEEITEVVGDEISKNYFFVWRGANTILFPKKDAENKLLENFKRIESVEINRAGLNQIEVLIKERSPEFTWCISSDASDEGSGDQNDLLDECFFMDGTGFVFAEAPSFSGNVYFRYYGLIDRNKAMGSFYLPEDKFSEMNLFKDRVESFGLVSTHIAGKDGGEFEIYLEEGSKIIFNLKNSLSQTANNLETVLYEKRVYEGREDFMSEIEYLDLSFGDKVFYK